MTAHELAQVIEDKYNQIDITDYNNDRLFYNFNVACGELDTYLREHFYDFEETELVTKWAKSWSYQRMFFDNWYRSFGWMYGDKKTANKHYKFNYEEYEHYRKSVRCY